MTIAPASVPPANPPPTVPGASGSSSAPGTSTGDSAFERCLDRATSDEATSDRSEPEGDGPREPGSGSPTHPHTSAACGVTRRTARTSGAAVDGQPMGIAPATSPPDATASGAAPPSVAADGTQEGVKSTVPAVSLVNDPNTAGPVGADLGLAAAAPVLAVGAHSGVTIGDHTAAALAPLPPPAQTAPDHATPSGGPASNVAVQASAPSAIASAHSVGASTLSPVAPRTTQPAGDARVSTSTSTSTSTSPVAPGSPVAAMATAPVHRGASRGGGSTDAPNATTTTDHPAAAKPDDDGRPVVTRGSTTEPTAFTAPASSTPRAHTVDRSSGPAPGADPPAQAEPSALDAKGANGRAAGPLRLDLDLSREGLGPMRLRATTVGGQLRVSLTATDAHVRSVLSTHAPELRRDLESAGLDLRSLDVGTSTAEHGGAGSTSQDHSQANPGHDRESGPNDSLSPRSASDANSPRDLAGSGISRRAPTSLAGLDLRL